MIFPDSTSFTRLATIHLPHPHLLNPASCNPSMDLVVLVAPSSSSAKSLMGGASGFGKGKSKATGGSKVALWRMGGSRVWEVEVDGDVAGLGWTRDGLFLSMLLLQESADTAKLEHRSVHTGGLVKAMSVAVTVASEDRREIAQGRRWCKLEWSDSGLDWAPPRNGSASMIIDSLPRVTPVEPPQPAVLNPFAKPVVPPPIGPHPKLAAFPCLLPSTPRIPPDILTITSPSGSYQKLLTGTLPLSSPLQGMSYSDQTLALAQVSDLIAELLEVVLRGLEGAEHAFRDGEKQTMIWREELETCGEQQGMSHADVHADLFMLLMAGRANPAVTEWLGNRLTGRTITKWESAVDTAYRTIGKLMAESIIPALERVVLLLEELRGWGRASMKLPLDSEAILEAIDLTCGFIRLAERIRQDATHEALAAGEWMEWLKFEIARVGHDASSDTMPLATYDLKLVWAFMTNGFISSVFKLYFPDLTVRPPTDELPKVMLPITKTRPFDLAAWLRENLDKLSSCKNKDGDVLSPLDADNSLASQFDRSLPSPLPEGKSLRAESPDDDELVAEGPSLGGMPGKHAEAKGVERRMEREPWVWANTLVRICEEVVRTAIGGIEAAVPPSGRPLTVQKGLSDVRRVEDIKWSAFIPGDGATLYLICCRDFDEQIPHSALSFNLEDATGLALQFFDDDELVLLLQSAEGERYLVTVRYSAVTGLVPLPPDVLRHSDLDEIPTLLTDRQPEALPISRCRSLMKPATQGEDQRIAIALNGRKGRRVGCVMMGGGREVEVLDLDADEDDDDEGGSEGEAGGEDEGEEMDEDE